MKSADLHVHSEYSNHPSEWFLKRIGASESYTAPETIYKTAKKKGLDYITITDHNSIEGALLLNRQYPDDTFVSVESTAYFPEDGCKVHILIFDITEEQFKIIQQIRSNIYNLRDYILANELAYSVAHATYSINNTVSTEHLEKLILLFDVFEGINGRRNKRSNREWLTFIRNLTKQDIHILQEKHKITPASETPWIKGITAGSDDHAGLFIGQTYTQCNVHSLKEYIESIKKKKSNVTGRHDTAFTMAYSIYKTAWEFTCQTSTAKTGPVSWLSSALFKNKKKGVINKFLFSAFNFKKKKKGGLHSILMNLIQSLQCSEQMEDRDKLDFISTEIMTFSDQMINHVFLKIEQAFKDRNFDELIARFSSLLPGAFLFTPFLTALSHMYSSRGLTSGIYRTLKKHPEQRKKKILWFTDTLTETNGVASTIKEIGKDCVINNRTVTIVCSLSEDEILASGGLPDGVVNFPLIFSKPLPAYEKLSLRVPALLESLQWIEDYDPDEIIISTPLIIGLFGLMASKLLNVPCTNIYHTDGTMQASKLIKDITMTTAVERYLKWFYESSDKILVNTKKYRQILSDRGWDLSKIEVFPRGIDTNLFNPVSALNFLSNKKSGSGIFKLIYAGRVSRDKNIYLLLDAFLQVEKDIPNIQLTIAGEGPERELLEKTYSRHQSIRFMGPIPHSELPHLFQDSDLLIFPSETDTLGRVVLEAGACGLPALVSSTGGPSELVEEGITGYIGPGTSAEKWAESIVKILKEWLMNPASQQRMKTAVLMKIQKEYNLSRSIDFLFPKGNNKLSSMNELKNDRIVS